MKKIVAIILVIVVSTVKADEGMWMPQLIKAMRYGDMKKNGFKLTAEQIYSINKASMKDAVIIFGGGCTGELISEKGLLLTNHHCGFSTIASLSSVEKDYLKNGFWAMSQNEEIPCPNLSVTFIKRIEDVTKKALQNTSKSNTDIKNDSIIQVNIASIAKDIKEKEGLSSIIRPFYYGNEYYLFVTEVFDDVRLVG
ncbi:MAG: S46 family peptidase, partial [Bacteroidia bacterium]